MRREWLLFVLMIACNGSRGFETAAKSGVSASTAAPEANADTAKADASQVADIPSPEAKSDAVNEEEDVGPASEPVSIGGAFLTCRYATETAQGNADYLLECAVGPTNALKAPLAKAEFAKLDAKGVRNVLAIAQEDLAGLKWILKETAGTLPLTQVEVQLEAAGYLTTKLSTIVTSGVPLKPVSSFWLAGEPNNQIFPGTTTGENCVEFGNKANQMEHQTSSGLTSGVYGRMNDVGCERTYSFLCRKVDASNRAKWMVSAFQGTYANRAQACLAGYAFGTPASESEVAEVSALIDANTAVFKVWVNMTDAVKEGTFVTHY